MNGEKVKQIVSEAFDSPTEQREAFVRRACGDDQSLLVEVLSLLDAASHAEDDGFLPSAARAGSAALATAPEHSSKPAAPSNKFPDIEAPERFGRYKVLERIGDGGMGIVYRAEQRTPMRREVVVKVIKLGMDTKLVIARFEAERQALAMMDHPHIAKVYDAGTDDRGRPYFVMEYVKGTPILDYCDRNHLTVHQRLELFTQVCQAIQHAHHKGIIHRDIKPSNILVSTQDGKPFAKVIDFGIAKATNQRLTDRTLFTEHVNMIGTPAYMSPEQADGNIDIDTRTDVYSLGVVLYELLTGHTPFDARRLKSVAFNEIARIIREEEPQKPSTLVSTINARPGLASSIKKASGDEPSGSGPTLATLAKARGSSEEAYQKSLRGEVDWIVMKAMEKDRARRYATPNELAEDVERHLNGLPILAAPPSLLYQASKFARKYRVAVTAGLSIALVLLLAIASVSGLAVELSHQVALARAALADAQAARVQESQQRQEAERQRGSAESAAKSAKYEAARSQAQYLIEQKLLDQALVEAKKAYALGGTWQDGLLLSQIVNESRKTWRLEHAIPMDQTPICAAISQTPDGMVLVAAFPSSLAEYDLETGQLLAQTKTSIYISQLLPFFGPSDQIAAISSSSVQVLSLADLSSLRQHDFGALGVIAADAGTSSIAVTLSDYTTQVYSDALTFLGSQPWPKDARLALNQPLEKLAISPDGQWVVSSGVTWSNDCLFWNLSTNKTFIAPGHCQGMRFVDNSNLIVTELSSDQGLFLERITIDPVHSTVSHVWLCTLSEDDIGAFAAVRHAADLRSIYLPYSRGYAAVTFGKTSGEFPDVVTQRYASLLGRNDLSPAPLALAADGSRFALLCKDRLLIFEQARAPRNDWANGHNAAFGASALYEVEPDATSLYVRITPADANRPAVRRRLALVPDAAPGLISIACGAAISQDQRTLAVRYAEADPHNGIQSGERTHNHKVVIYSGLDPMTGRPGNTPPIEVRLITQDDTADTAAHEYRNERILQLSPDGRYLLVGSHVTFESSQAELYRTADGRLIHYWAAGQLSGLVTSLGNPQYFADASLSGDSIRLISWETGNVEREIKAPGKVLSLCGAARGEDLLASIDGKTIVCYSVKTGELLRSFDCTLQPVDSSPDDKVFIGYQPETQSNGSMLLADGQTGSAMAILQRGTKWHTLAQFTSDGQSFMLPSTLDTTDLVRNLSPQAADRILDSSGDASANLGAEPPTIELPPIKVFPVAPLSEVAATPSTIIDGTDMAKLSASIGTRVIVQGAITSINMSTGHNALIISFGEYGKCFNLFVPPKLFAAVNAQYGGNAATALKQKLVRVTGTIVIYNQLPEIVLDDVAHLQIVDTDQAPAP
ncbi:MAG: serine/threonine-protein kinase [Tepidisphaeraceae bacterium]|jgi:serine/threonine protein kinase/WD40 repeat protein